MAQMNLEIVSRFLAGEVGKGVFATAHEGAAQYCRKVDKREIPVCPILGVNIAVINMNWLLKYLAQNIHQLQGDYICVSNVHTTVVSYEDADYRAVQNGVSTERSTAQKIAMQNCRQDLAAAIQADVKTVIENYVKNQDTGISAEHKSQYQELAYTAVNQQLRDVQIVEEKMFRQDNGSMRYYVCMQLPKAALEAAVEDAIAKDAKLNLEFDRAQFKKIFEEQMAAFAQ